jgi:hypothetical protein
MMGQLTQVSYAFNGDTLLIYLFIVFIYYGSRDHALWVIGKCSASELYTLTP